MQKEFGNVFVEGAISPDFIANAITAQQGKTDTGAHDIFLGQVRADVIDGKTVSAIEYTAYEGMAIQKLQEIQEAAFDQFDLTGVHIYHSLGKVKVGEICLFVLVSSPHRKEVFKGLHYVVEAIKKEVPVFGRELFGDDLYQWKVNT